MSASPNLTSNNVRRSSRYVAFGIMGVSVIALLVAQQDHAQKVAIPTTKATKADSSPVQELHIEAQESKKPAEEALNANGRRSLAFYTKSARGTLFSEPLPPEPKPAPPPPPQPTPPPVRLPEIDPFAGWAYTGTVTINGQKMVLLENATTKEGQYLHIGEVFMGGQVSDISDSNVTIMVGNKPRQMFKSQNYNVVPLSASASGGGGQPGQPGMPGPGGMPGGAPPPPPPPVFTNNAIMGRMMEGQVLRSFGSGRAIRMNK